MARIPLTSIEYDRRSFLHRGLLNQAVCGFISVPFWLLSHRDSRYWIVASYSFVIGNLIWLFIDGGRHLIGRFILGRKPDDTRKWPGWPTMIFVIAFGTIAGYTVGTAIVDALLGFDSPTIFTSQSTAVITVLVAAATTYFFYSRERIHVEMAEAEAARRLAVENQLKLLESQLEPHMLFNTLANLRVLIGIDPPRAQAMLDRLIAFLRSTLNASRTGAHPLSAEFDRITDYLALMSVRMGARLSARFDLPDALQTRSVPPLLLQPLVENAIKHGLEPKVEGGRIEVSAHEDGGLLVLTVRDTGVGLDAGSPTGGTRFGLTQVRERLKVLYGDRASLTLAAADDPEGGTRVTVRLPSEPGPSASANPAAATTAATSPAPPSRTQPPCPPR